MDNRNKVIIVLSLVILGLVGMLLYKIFTPKTINEVQLGEKGIEENVEISNMNTFSNETLKIDIPKNYTHHDYGIADVFISDDSVRMIAVCLFKSNGLKRDINSITQEEIDKVVNNNNKGSNKIIAQTKEQLGENETIKLRTKDEDNTYTYSDMYILASDKHLIAVMFSGSSIEDLDNIEFQNVKASFELKEKIINSKIYIALVILMFIIAVVLRIKLSIGRRD